MAYWVHSLNPYIIQFPETWILPGIRWYGLAYLLGFLCAQWLLKRWYQHGKITLTPHQQQTALWVSFLGLMMGGRLGYVFLYQPQYYWAHPWKIFSIWEGGMASHGAFLGIFIAWALWTHKQAFSALSLADLALLPGTLGIFCGRCANFINGEVYGTVTQVPWAVIFPNDPLPRHPSQLYEAIGEGAVLFFWTLHHLRRDPNLHKKPGLVSSQFLIYYGIIRCFLEQFREPDAPRIGYFTRGQVYSILAIFIGLICCHTIARRPNRKRSLFSGDG